MRIVRLKLKKETTTLLKEVAKEFSIDDPGFVEDLFALLKFRGNGLPDKERIKQKASRLAKKYDKSETGLSLLISKRKMLLEALVQTSVFQGYAQLIDRVEACKRMLLSFTTLHRKVREAQCKTCHLLTRCRFGQQYSESARNISRVYDADYDKKVHPDCPALPEIGAFNKLLAGAQAFQKLAGSSSATQALMNQSPADRYNSALLAKANAGDLNEFEEPDVDDFAEDLPDDDIDEDADPDDEADFIVPPGAMGAGKGGGSSQHTGEHICKVAEKFIQEVSQAQLCIFELGRKFSIALGGKDAKDFKPVPHIDQDKDPQTIKSIADVTKIDASQHALPDEVFDKKLMGKELVMQQHQKKDDKKKLLYLLIDSSASMNAQLGSSNSRGLFTRGSLATVMSMSLIEKLKRDKGIVFVRFFACSPSARRMAEKKDEYDTLAKYVVSNNYSGGGTNITAAVKAAIEDICAAETKSELASAEILCITDCEDYINKKELKEATDKREFHVLDVSGGNHRINQALKFVATKYLKVNETRPDVNKLVDEIV